MWLVFRLKEEFRKIKQSFKKRDKDILNNSKDLNKLKEDLNNNSLKIARLEGVLSMVLKSQSQKVSVIPNKSQGKIETKVINRIRRSKKSLVMSEIKKLEGSMPVINMFETIVKERGLCSKASFYRYISSLNSLKVKETEIKIR